MGTLGVPGLNPSKYTHTEEQIGEWWRKALEEDMLEAGREEKEHAVRNRSCYEGVPAITVVCWMMVQKVTQTYLQCYGKRRGNFWIIY